MRVLLVLRAGFGVRCQTPVYEDMLYLQNLRVGGAAVRAIESAGLQCLRFSEAWMHTTDRLKQTEHQAKFFRACLIACIDKKGYPI
jgi:hypothetical protein